MQQMQAQLRKGGIAGKKKKGGPWGMIKAR
jgi:hypothetical protein